MFKTEITVNVRLNDLIKWINRDDDFCHLIQPVGNFKNQSTVSRVPASGNIIVGINHKKIGNRLVTPLQPHVDVHVVDLLVVLYKS